MIRLFRLVEISFMDKCVIDEHPLRMSALWERDWVSKNRDKSGQG